MPFVEEDRKPNPKDGIGFTGTKDGLNGVQKLALQDRLAWLKAEFDWFHHGDCVGADAEAHAIAKGLGYKIAIHPPDNPSKRAFCKGTDYEYDRQPYLVRNHSIVDNTTFLIAGPRTMQMVLRSGTWATVRYAKRVSKYVLILATTGRQT